jgi:hypothetical protein
VRERKCRRKRIGGANPVEFVLHALAACLTTSLVYHAAARGIHIESAESTLESDLDLRGFLGLSDTVRKGYQNIRVGFKIKSDAPAEQLRELCKFSPVFDSYRTLYRYPSTSRRHNGHPHSRCPMVWRTERLLQHFNAMDECRSSPSRRMVESEHPTGSLDQDAHYLRGNQIGSVDTKVDQEEA